MWSGERYWPKSSRWGKRAMSVAVPQIQLPTRSKVSFRLEVTADFNISAAAARRRANRFLAVNAGNMLAAGEPELVIGPELNWRVPVLFGTPGRGRLGKVGELFVSAETGDVMVDSPSQLEEMMQRAEILYSRAASAAGTGL